MKKLLALAALFLASPALSATFYVDCTAPDDRAPGDSPANAWKTIDKVNRSSFVPGDSILFKRGCTWREMLVPPSSGSPNGPITFGAYGSGADPIVSGADLVTNWIRVQSFSTGGENVYSAPIAWMPYVVQEDGVRLTRVAGLGAVTAAGMWYSDGSTVYVWAMDNADPDTHRMEVGRRTYSVYINARNYVTVDHIQCIGANDGGVYIEWGGNHCTVSSCTVRNIGHQDWGAGIRMRGGTNNLFTRNTVSYAWTGITIEDWGPPSPDSTTVSHNTVHDLDSAGMGIAAHTVGSTTNTIIEYNDVYSCVKTSDDQPGIGIYQAGTGTIIRHNKVHNNGSASARGTGINLDTGSAAAECYYNIIYENNWGCIGITASGHRIYGNTCYHNNEGPWNVGELTIFNSGASMTIKNNTVVASVTKYLLAVGSGSTSGHTIDYNDWYGSDASRFSWGGTVYNFANYQANSGQDTHSFSSDPRLTDAPGGVFTLLEGSPCIDAGEDLGSTYQAAPMPGSAWPGSVVTGDQYREGRSWEIGAYLFPDGGSSPPPPTPTPTPSGLAASFTFLPDTPHQGELVQFTDTSTGATNWNWDFGDGTRSMARNAVHTYSARGTYTVILWVGNGVSYSQAVKTVTTTTPVRKHLPMR